MPENNQEVAMTVIEEKGLLSKILNFIRNIFKKKKQIIQFLFLFLYQFHILVSIVVNFYTFANQYLQLPL